MDNPLRFASNQVACLERKRARRRFIYTSGLKIDFSSRVKGYVNAYWQFLVVKRFVKAANRHNGSATGSTRLGYPVIYPKKVDLYKGVYFFVLNVINSNLL